MAMSLAPWSRLSRLPVKVPSGFLEILIASRSSKPLTWMLPCQKPSILFVAGLLGCLSSELAFASAHNAKLRVIAIMILPTVFIGLLAEFDQGARSSLDSSRLL